MKVGILTFHAAHNYGAVIQCYTLQQYIRQLGHETFIIDYRPYFISEYKKGVVITRNQGWRAFVSSIIHEPYLSVIRNKRYNGFASFINRYFNFIPSSFERIKDLDAIIIGSDQVWNPQITGGSLDNMYFASMKCERQKIISYAASSRFKSLSEPEKKYLKVALCRFTSISVREDNLKELLQPLTTTPIHVVVDPTLLAEQELLNKLTFPIVRKREYILIYEIVPHKSVYNKAMEMAKQLDCDVIELSSSISRHGLMHKDQSATPEKFLSYIKYTKCIFTTSFHGTALAILFKKDFYAFRQNSDADLRIDSLLNNLKLKDRFVDQGAKIEFSNIDYDITDFHKNAFIEESRRFISKSLES